MPYPKRSQNKYTKKAYKVRNWRKYEHGLRGRGDLTLWFSETAITGWRASPRRVAGGQRVYTNLAIETALTVRMVYHLALRQTEGFLRSIVQLLDVDLPIPDHTTLSRRGRTLGSLCFRPTGNRPMHLLIDSTGLTIHAGYAFKPPRKRAWRKLHVGTDRTTGDIVAVELTANRARDAARLPGLLRQVDRPLASVAADAAYDTERVYRSIEKHTRTRSPRVLIPRAKNAQVNAEASRQRNRNIRLRNQLGKREWHKASGYSRRSLVENTMFRYKAIIGPSMRARTLAGQRVEARLGAAILNRMTGLGMPDSSRVE